MSRPSRYDIVSIDELFAEATIDVRPVRHSPIVALLSLVTAAALVGVAFAGMASPAALAASATVDKAAYFWDSLPSDLPTEASLPQHTVLLDKAGVEFARFYSENRVDVDYEQISPNFINALVATEDSRFFEHGGVDLQGVARALVKNVAGGSATEGASTITQQLVQNILISNATNEVEEQVATGDTYESKLREIKYAVNLEQTMTKEEILTAYSNAVFLGNRAYGVEAAALVYFNTTAANLTVPQAATLVALLKSPIKFDPYVDAATATGRRDIVIDRMSNEGYITESDAAAAKAEPITLTHGDTATGCANSAYPYYCALVRDDMLTDSAFGSTPEARAETLRRGGLTITTALDRTVTDASTAAVNRALGTDNRVASATATVIPGTGHISSVAQNRTWDQTEIVYAKSVFQPGSVMKPLTLVTALEQGLPITTKFPSNGPYKPARMDAPPGGFTNAGGQKVGTIDARAALRMSVNVYFVKLIEKTGVLPVADMASRLGISSIPELSGREAGLALGNYEVSPLQMANVYATFASGGIKCNPVSIVSAVRTSTGESVDVPDPDCHQELDSAIAAQMSDALGGAFQPGGTLAAVGSLPGRAAGGKTGTTDNSSANWTAGMTAQFATAVWVGDPRGGQAYPLKSVRAYGRTISSTVGASIAGPEWKELMVAIHSGLPAIPFPGAGGNVLRVIVTKQVPDVRGLTTGAAVAALTEAGYVASINAAAAADDGINKPGIVVAQTPAAGDKTGTDTNVTLTLSNGSETNVELPAAR